MKKFVLISLVLALLASIIFTDPIASEKFKSQYYVLKADRFGDYKSLVKYLQAYDGEAQSKVKYLHVGKWAKNNTTSFSNTLKMLNKEQCENVLEAINIQLQDIGENVLSGCKY